MIKTLPPRSFAFGLVLLLTSAITTPASAQDAPIPSLAATPSDVDTSDPHAHPEQEAQNIVGVNKPVTGPAMDMDSMQGGKAPQDARDTDDYADGYRNSTLSGFEMADKLAIPKLLVDELEFTTGNEGQGVGWTVLFTKGQDNDKFWLRSQGLKNSQDRRLDPESSVEALWWNSNNPFWGTLLGVRQDLGKGGTTWLAAGVEGLAPYWFDIQLTGYVGNDGRLAARAKASYEVLFTNRLILTPQVETNIYSKRSSNRQLGSGFSNVELSGRLRYEVSRKFAPYMGFVWERAFDGTAEFRRLRGEGPSEHRLVFGLRAWW